MAKLNSYRGSHSHSIAISNGKSVSLIKKDFGEFDYDNETLNKLKDDEVLFIGHVQAPTTESTDASSIHPSNDMGDYLWHNGIIKEHQVKQWQTLWKKDWSWDTKWLLYLMNAGDTLGTLAEADGSFACLWAGKYNPSLQLFRNENCPMFIDGHSFSSTKFDNAQQIDAGVIYNFTRDGWQASNRTFETKTEFFWAPA